MLVALLAGSLLPSCRRSDSSKETTSSPAGATAWFEEVSDEVGVDFRHVAYLTQRYYLPEIMSGGVALFDYNRDGHLDIYFVQGGHLEGPQDKRPGNKLLRNRGDGTFEDVTEAAGVGDRGYGMGCACGDYDRDGDTDLYVTNVGPNVLYRNNGDGTFTDVTEEAGVGDPRWGTSCAFVDYDGDGDLDIFAVNYLNWAAERELDCKIFDSQQDYCHPMSYQAPVSDTLYRNNGDGSFTNVSESVGLTKAFGNGLGVATGDFNEDGFVDVYVANDATANQLWKGRGGGRLEDEALLDGCALNGVGAAEAGMGVMAVDIDDDGDEDLLLAHLHNESNTLYRNDAGFFEDCTTQMGLATPSLPFTGFGLGVADFNHDGQLDIYIVNGRVKRHEPTFDPANPYAEPNQMFRGREKGNFAEVTDHLGMQDPLIENSRGAAFGDIDNDGDIDAVVVNVGAPAHVLRNIASTRGGWIMFRVLNQAGADALGARVRITTQGHHRWRTVQAAYSYCASNDPRVHFGLGAATAIEDVTVNWPDGKTERFGPYTPGALYKLEQGHGQSP